MEFWGVEVPSGKPLTCEPGPESYVHVSQAALGDNKSGKGNERVLLRVKTGATEVVVGTLSQGNCDQTPLDLIFEKDFVLSHNGGSSVFFCGYKTDAVKDDMGSSDEEEDFEEDSDEDDAAPMEVAVKENGKAMVKQGKPEVAGNKKPAPKPLTAKADADAKPKEKKPVFEGKSKGAKPKGGDDDESDEDEEDDDEEDDDDEAEDMSRSDSEDLDLDSDEEDESDEDDEDESEEEEQPKSAGEKRPAPAAQKPNLAKKAKLVTPGKIDSKSPSAPASTPKQQQQSGKKDQSGKKTPGKENSNTPASGKKLGQFVCQPCKKNFNSESALTQHQAAKHK